MYHWSLQDLCASNCQYTFNVRIPAQISKVKKIVVANPRISEKLNPAVCMLQKMWVSEIITCGGAQAIGNLAYIQKVNKIVGPGSDITAEAKRLVFGTVGLMVQPDQVKFQYQLIKKRM